jgi:hypothetical protein
MKPFTSPELVFNRPPNQLDRASRFGKMTVNFVRAVISNGEKAPGKLEQESIDLEERLKYRTYDFAETWRENLGDRLETGVCLRVDSNPDYTIDALISKRDKIFESELQNDSYRTQLAVAITQKSGLVSRWKISTWKSLFSEAKQGRPASDSRASSYADIKPLNEKWNINGDGWGYYLNQEIADLNKLALSVLDQIDQANTSGELQILPASEVMGEGQIFNGLADPEELIEKRLGDAIYDRVSVGALVQDRIEGTAIPNPWRPYGGDRPWPK